MDGVAGEAGDAECGLGSHSAESLEETVPRRDSLAAWGCF